MGLGDFREKKICKECKNKTTSKILHPINSNHLGLQQIRRGKQILPKQYNLFSHLHHLYFIRLIGPTRDHGTKRSSPPVFLNHWLNFRVRGQFEIKILIVRGHSDINTTKSPSNGLLTQHISYESLEKINLSLRSFETGILSADNFTKY